MTITKITCISAFLTAFAALALAAPAMADDDGDPPSFTLGSIAGAWGFSAFGVIMPPGASHGMHVAAVGIMTFDGAGGCTITDTINFGGLALPDRVSDGCVYDVNPDGSGTILADFAGDPAPVPLSFTIVDRARTLHFIRTDAGIASGIAQRQHPGDD